MEEWLGNERCYRVQSLENLRAYSAPMRIMLPIKYRTREGRGYVKEGNYIFGSSEKKCLTLYMLFNFYFQVAVCV